MVGKQESERVRRKEALPRVQMLQTDVPSTVCVLARLWRRMGPQLLQATRARDQVCESEGEMRDVRLSLCVGWIGKFFWVDKVNRSAPRCRTSQPRRSGLRSPRRRCSVRSTIRYIDSIQLVYSVYITERRELDPLSPTERSTR